MIRVWHRVALVCGLLLLPSSARAGDAAPETLSTTRYIIGGLNGTFVGFGLGHLIQRRFLERGWIFTSGQVLGLMMCGVGLATSGPSHSHELEKSTAEGGESGAFWLFMGGVFVYGGLRFWEMVDVWRLPGRYKDNRQAAQAQSQPAAPRFMLAPLADRHVRGMQLSLTW